MGGPSIVSVKMSLAVFALLTYASTQASAAVTLNVTADDRFPLHIAMLVALTGIRMGTSFETGAALAVEHINSNRDMLPGYRLKLTTADTEVGISVGVATCVRMRAN